MRRRCKGKGATLTPTSHPHLDHGDVKESRILGVLSPSRERPNHSHLQAELAGFPQVAAPPATSTGAAVPSLHPPPNPSNRPSREDRCCWLVNEIDRPSRSATNRGGRVVSPTITLVVAQWCRCHDVDAVVCDVVMYGLLTGVAVCAGAGADGLTG